MLPNLLFFIETLMSISFVDFSIEVGTTAHSRLAALALRFASLDNLESNLKCLLFSHFRQFPNYISSRIIEPILEVAPNPVQIQLVFCKVRSPLPVAADGVITPSLPGIHFCRRPGDEYEIRNHKESRTISVENNIGIVISHLELQNLDNSL